MPQGQSEETNFKYQTRLWDSYPAKSPNLRHPQASSQNKGLSRASRLQTGPSPTRRRKASRRQPELERGKLGLRDGIPYQTHFQLLTKSSWDPGQLTSAGRVAAKDQLSRGNTGHT